MPPGKGRSWCWRRTSSPGTAGETDWSQCRGITGVGAGGRRRGGSVPVPGEERTLRRGRSAGAGAEGGRPVPVPGSKD